MKWPWCAIAVALSMAGVQAQGLSGAPRRYAGVTELDVVANLGRVSIEAWARPEVEIEAKHSAQVDVEIKSGPTVEVREHRTPRASLERVDYVMRVPPAIRIRLWSHSAAVTIRGVHGDVEIHGQLGHIDVSDAGNARLNTTTGDITLKGARGAAWLESTAGRITANGLRGNVVAETVGGTITLTDLTGEKVEVTTTGADIQIDGAPRPGGVYDIASQAGAVSVRLPAAIGARISYGTVRGRFHTNVPQDAAHRAEDGRTTLPVGDGSARIDIITFSGDITVLRQPPQ
jgi:hypothetical protein